MREFNVGDRVIYINEKPDAHDAEYHLHKGMTGTVTEIRSKFVPCVSFDNYRDGFGLNDDEVHVFCDDIALYDPDFKFGDRVELLKQPNNIHLKPGMTGRIYVEKTIFNRPVVEFDNFHEGWGDDENKWFVSSNILKKIEEPKPKFDVGDIVKANHPMEISGEIIGKIINISRSSFGQVVYLVEFNETNYLFHDGDIQGNVLIKGAKTGKDGYCYYYTENRLAKYVHVQKPMIIG